MKRIPHLLLTIIANLLLNVGVTLLICSFCTSVIVSIKTLSIGMLTINLLCPAIGIIHGFIIWYDFFKL